MQPEFFAFCSNRVEKLLAELCQDISAHTESSGLLAFRCIVPSSSLKVWLTHELMAHGIAPLAGEVIQLEEALALHVPSRRAILPLLMVFLEKSQEELWGSKFLSALRESLPLSKERILYLAKKHLVYFAQMAFLDDDEWFRKKNLECVAEAFKKVWPKDRRRFSQVPTFLFGFSSLHVGALTRLLSLFSVKRLSFLSPSTLFWGDMPSDSEVRVLLKNNPSEAFEEALLPYVNDRQRLLANAGVVGREFFNLLEDLELPVRSSYIVPASLVSLDPYRDYALDADVEKTFSTPSLLDHVKADLLYLVGERKDPQNISQDFSLEIHAAYTVLREVEALADALFRYFGGHPLKPASVLVLVSDMERYAAPLEQVFGGEKSLYQLWNEEEQEEATFSSLLLHFFCSPGGKKELLSLVRHKKFLKAFGVAKEEQEDLIALLEKSSVTIFSEKIRTRYLNQRGISSLHTGNTFQEHYKKECQKLFHDEDVLTKSSVLSFFAKINEWVSSVEREMALPIDTKEFFPFSIWVKFFEVLFLPFMHEESSFFSVQKVLTAFKGYAQEAFLPYREVHTLFFSELRDRAVSSKLGLRAPIICAEFGEFQPFPVEVVAILGSEEGSLPKEEEDPLKYLEKLPPTVYPSSSLFERYAFLEALLSAQRLFIGYQSYAFELRESVPYSSLVADLVLHLDGNYRINGKKPSEVVCTTHPLYQKRRGCSSPHDVEAMPRKQRLDSFIDLADIQKTAKNPLAMYCKKQLGASDEWEEKNSLFIRPYELKMHLEEAVLGKNAFTKREHALALHMYAEGEKETAAALQAAGVASVTSMDVEFLATITELTLCEGFLQIPSIEVQGKPLQGVWKGLSKEGILLFSETWKYELFQKWPEYVFRSFLAKKFSAPFAEEVILVHEKRKLSLPIQDPETLFFHWVEFSQVASQFPFPFSYQMVRGLFKGTLIEELIVEKNSAVRKEHIDLYKGMWEEWAQRLYTDLLVRGEQ